MWRKKFAASPFRQMISPPALTRCQVSFYFVILKQISAYGSRKYNAINRLFQQGRMRTSRALQLSIVDCQADLQRGGHLLPNSAVYAVDQFAVVLTCADFDRVTKSCKFCRLGSSSMDVTKIAEASRGRCFQRCSTTVDRKETAGYADIERVCSCGIRRVLL